MSEIKIKEILDLLPHRYPFVLVDRVLQLVPGDSIRALKNVTINEPFFQGHFPVEPVMPAVLILEAMAQTGALLAFLSSPDEKGKLAFFVGMDEVRFRRKVVPGDQLIISVEKLKQKGKIWKVSATATVEGERAAEAILMASVE